jgi:hypothetical protein
MPPALTESVLFTRAGALGHSARGVGTGRSLGALGSPVTRLELGPFGDFCGRLPMPCHDHFITGLAAIWQQTLPKNTWMAVDKYGHKLPSDKVFYSTIRSIGRSSALSK